LTIVLIVLGAVVSVAYGAVIGSSTSFSISSSLDSALAATQTQAAYEALQAPTSTFVTTSKACRADSTSTGAELSCLQGADSAFATAIRGYESALGQISYPSSAQGDARAAIAAARDVVTILESLVTATDAQAYSAISTGPAYSASLHALDSTYSQLMSTLNSP